VSRCTSAAQDIAGAAPASAHVVKAFNAVFGNALAQDRPLVMVGLGRYGVGKDQRPEHAGEAALTRAGAILRAHLAMAAAADCSCQNNCCEQDLANASSMADVQNRAELPLPAGPRADVAAFELLTQALVGITTQSLDALDGAVTVSQFRLLRTLDALGRVPSSTLATALQTAASSVTRLVDKLEAAGFVARGSDANSRSIVTVEVTEAGHAVVTHVLGRRHALLQAVLDAMDPAERDHAATAAARFAQLAGDAVAAGAGAL
jgi:DNA-binding MarR family transcriptional regulator